MKAWLLKISNGVLYLVLCVLAGTGLLLELRLDDRHGGGILGLSKEDWGEFHFVLALVFLAIMVVHLILNWNWIATMLKGKGRKSIVLTGVTGLVLMLGILLAPSAGGGEHQNAESARQHVDD